MSALLNDGRVRVTGLYSEKTGKTYDATVVLELSLIHILLLDEENSIKKKLHTPVREEWEAEDYEFSDC